MTRSPHAVRARSAGILLYRRTGAGALEILLGHPGGPFWSRRDKGAWMVPKGAIEAGEDEEAAARREFAEEVGPLPAGALRPLATIRQKAGKLVSVFALEGEFDPAKLRSGEFELEWPPKSGEIKRYPELDRVEWMGLAEARGRMLASQLPLLDALVSLLGEDATSEG